MYHKVNNKLLIMNHKNNNIIHKKNNKIHLNHLINNLKLYKKIHYKVYNYKMSKVKEVFNYIKNIKIMLIYKILIYNNNNNNINNNKKKFVILLHLLILINKIILWHYNLLELI